LVTSCMGKHCLLGLAPSCPAHCSPPGNWFSTSCRRDALAALAAAARSLRRRVAVASSCDSCTSLAQRIDCGWKRLSLASLRRHTDTCCRLNDSWNICTLYTPHQIADFRRGQLLDHQERTMRRRHTSAWHPLLALSSSCDGYCVEVNLRRLLHVSCMGTVCLS